MAKVDVIKKEIKVPDGVTIGLKENVITVKGPKGEMNRRFYHPRVELKKEGKTVVVHCDKPKRPEMGLAGTWIADLGRDQGIPLQDENNILSLPHQDVRQGK